MNQKAQIKKELDPMVLTRLNKVVQDYHVNKYPEDFKPHDIYSVEKAFAGMIAQENYKGWSAWIDNRCVGYLVAFENIREANAFQFEKKFLLIDQLAVHPDHRNKGIAAKLMEVAEESARSNGIHHTVLESWQENEFAQKFFERQGYEPEKIRYSKEV